MIRRATVSDHSWIAKLSAVVYKDLGNYGDVMPEWLLHPGVLAYIECDSAGNRRGFILLGFYETEEGDTSYVADLLAIGVAPRCQRKGVGRTLLKHALGLARLAGESSGDVPEMRLTVADTNEAGQKLFCSSGFTILEDDHGSYDGGQRAIRMYRPLT